MKLRDLSLHEICKKTEFLCFQDNREISAAVSYAHPNVRHHYRSSPKGYIKHKFFNFFLILFPVLIQKRRSHEFQIRNWFQNRSTHFRDFGPLSPEARVKIYVY